MTDKTIIPMNAILRIVNLIGYISAIAWIVMVLFVGNALAEHRSVPHASAASKQEVSIVRQDVASNAQSIISNERFSAAMRAQNIKEHGELQRLMLAQTAVIDKIWDKINK